MNTLIDKYYNEFEQYTANPSKKLAISIRASLLEISKFCAVQRAQFLQESKNMPTKPRSKKLVPITPEVSTPVPTPEPVPEPVPDQSKKDNLKVPRTRAPSKRKTQ